MTTPAPSVAASPLSRRDRVILLGLAQRINPTDAGAHNNLGVLYFNKGLVDEAVAEFERAIELDMGLSVARRNLEISYLASGHYQRTAVELAERLRTHPEDVETRRLLVRAVAAAARARGATPPDAETDNDAGASIEPYLSLDRYDAGGGPAPDVSARPTALPDRYLGHYHEAITLRQKGEYRAAMAELRRALDAGEDGGLVRQAMAELHLIDGTGGVAEPLYRALLDEDASSPKLWNEFGVCAHQRGQMELAEERYRTALEADAAYSLAWNNLGVVRAHEDDLAGAAECLARSTEHHATLIDGWCNLGLCEERRERPGPALRAYRRALDVDVRAVAAWLGVGRISIGVERYDDARNALARAVESAPDSAAARYQLAFALTKLGDYQGALRETKRALALNPYYPAPRFRLAIDLQFEHAEVLAPELDAEERVVGSEVADFEFSAAGLEPIFKKMNAARPSSAPAVVPITPLAMARELLDRGLLARAGAEVRRAAIAGADLVEAALLMGEILLRQDLDGEALERFDAALARLSGQPWDDRVERSWLGRSRALLHLHRAAEARSAAEAVLAQAPDHDAALRLRAEAMLVEGRAAEAVDVFARVVRGAPGDPRAFEQLAMAREAAGDARGAEDALRRAARLDGEYVPARVRLGEILLGEGRLDEAARELNAALDVAPEHVDAKLALAEVERRRARHGDAVTLLVDVLTADAYHLTALARLGRVLDESGRPDDARRALQRVLRFDPENAEARLHLDRMEAAMSPSLPT